MKKTVTNLAKAFVGESQARNRYGMYAKTAEKEGFPEIADIFHETAGHEQMHAKTLYKMLLGLRAAGEAVPDTLHIEAEVPLSLGSTADNLRAAIGGEHYENATMYPEFAATAEAEGFNIVAARLRAIANAERYHEDRYAALLRNIEESCMFKDKPGTKWVCRKCGYVHEGPEPAAKCPSCEHGSQHFQRVK